MSERRAASARAGAHGRRRPLGDDLLRPAVALLPAVAVAGLVLGPDGVRLHGDRLVTVWAWCLLLLAVFVATHCLLTVLAFRGLEGEDLRREVLASTAGHGAGRGALHPLRARVAQEGTSPHWSAQLALVAMVACLGVAVVPDLQGQTWMVPLCIALVVIAWAEMVVAYAVQYARLDLRFGGLDFPGDERERAFSDYVYQAVAGQATFGSTDVSVTTTAMRRTVTGHALIAFCFNTVVLGIAVSLLAG